LEGSAQIIGTLYFKVGKVVKTIGFLYLEEKDPFMHALIVCECAVFFIVI